MTQDEILKAALEKYITEPLGSVPMPALYAALDQYAEQQAVSFTEWISNHRLDFQTASNGRWIGLDMEILTCSQLYQLFSQRKLDGFPSPVGEVSDNVGMLSSQGIDLVQTQHNAGMGGIKMDFTPRDGRSIDNQDF